MGKHTFTVFVFGAVLGSVVTWYCVKDKYERYANEEIASVKETFSARKEKKNRETGKSDIPKDGEASVSEYAKILADQGYTNYSNTETIPEEKPATKRPYVISPDEFGEAGYDRISFTLYADNVLADDGDIPVGDVDGTVGSDSLSHFGEYEDDSVFVRNDRLKVDYEILLSQRTYAEVVESKPYLATEV